MLRILLVLAAALLAALPLAASRAASYDLPATPLAEPAADAMPPDSPAYDGDRLRPPADYREWIYATTGLDMSYSRIALPGHHMFDSVFVKPAAWQAFKRTGTWPDKTVLVLETRGASTQGSINRHGYFQDGAPMGLEVHVKDTARFEDGGWAFFSFDDLGKPGERLPRGNDCASCHQAHGAVDATFVQFYPTFLPIARAHGTLSPGYLRDVAQDGQAPR